MAYIVTNPLTGKNKKVNTLEEAKKAHREAMVEYLNHSAGAFAILEVKELSDGSEQWTRIEPETGIVFSEVVREAIRVSYKKVMSGEEPAAFGPIAIRQVLTEDGVLT